MAGRMAVVSIVLAYLCQCSFASSTFDCATQAESWQVAWSFGKTFWCCRHEHKGCSNRKNLSMPHFCLSSLSNWEESQENGRTLWCCRHKHGDCLRKLPTLPYACHVDLSNWKTAWSDKKKLWCCLNECKGCPLAPACLPGVAGLAPPSSARLSSASPNMDEATRSMNASFAEGSFPHRWGHQEPFSILHICEICFALIFVSAAAHFIQKGCNFVYNPGKGGCAEESVPVRSSMIFHTLAGTAALAMASTHALRASGSNNLIWIRYGGRLTTSACLSIALGYVHGGRLMDIFPALALATGAWGQIAVASAAIVEPGVYCGLCFSGIFMGSVALHIIYSFEDRFRAPLPDPEPRRWMVDLALLCNVGYLLLWLAFELNHTDQSAGSTPLFGTLLNGCIDIIYGWGICRMLTKREHLLQKVCCLSKSAYWQDVRL